MTAEEMWKLSCIQGKYEAWAFGSATDELAQLVKQGVKTGTSSAYPLYALEGEALPAVGDHSVILNAQDEAVCIIRNVAVTVLPYRLVTERMAYLEGEGDRSLAYWQGVHEVFFRECMAEAGLRFTLDMSVVFEEFIKVYP